jgi:hypothetical protein
VRTPQGWRIATRTTQIARVQSGVTPAPQT